MLTTSSPLSTAPSEADALRPKISGAPAEAPLLTIAIPAYNRPPLLQEALASIALLRCPAEVEILVCDDGGLPETRRVVEASGLPVRFHVNTPRLGAVGNWNRCIELARGRWVTLLHEDDVLYPWFLTLVRPRLRAGISAVAVRCAQGEKPPALPLPPPHPRCRDYAAAWFLKSSMTPFPGVVFSRAAALRIGGFDAGQAGLADYTFWYELARLGRIEVVRETAAFYRLSEGQWTEREWPAMLRRAHLLRLRIAREQLPGYTRLGRWLARFYTGRMARSYARRFEARPAGLARARRFERIALAWLSSGWVWQALQLAPALTRGTPRSSLRRPLSPQTGRP